MSKASVALGLIGLSSLLVGCDTAAERSESLRESVRRSRCEPSFQSFGINSGLSAISADGTVAVGAIDGHDTPLRYDGTFTFLPLPEGSSSASAVDISADGSVVAGYGSGLVIEAVLWRGEEITRLGFVDTSNRYSVSLGMSSDGKVVVGYAGSDFGLEAFRWDERTGMVGLGVGGVDNRAMAADRHGRVVVGISFDGSAWRPFVWTKGRGSTLLSIPEGYVHGFAYDVSSNGKVVVGELDMGGDFPSSYPARWTKKDGWELLDTVEGAAGTATRDGSTIGGTRFAPIGEPWTAMLWDEERGPLAVADLLIEAGVSLGDLNLDSVNDISDDGKVVVGSARDSTGFSHAFIACLP